MLLGGPEGDPILATWSAGIGRSAAFTSDFKDRWGAPWSTWPGGAKMIGQLGRDIARKADDPRVRLESDATGGELHVRADVVGDDGRAQTFRRLTVHVAGPDGFSRDVALEAIGAGRYARDRPALAPRHVRRDREGRGRAARPSARPAPCSPRAKSCARRAAIALLSRASRR